jgi:alkanesulfonate monooxygenase SsuD/methylene tetrahydromethanopterin reductase-like flavin-dependent oxidoreductase (luciferase family)
MVKLGVMVPMSRSDGPGRMPSWAEVRAFAEHAETIGLDSVWVCDHLISGPPGGPPEGIHEGWTLVGALAASTRRVEVGQLVMCVSFRNPGLLAKMAVTADEVSSGRVVLGLGAGWYDAEYKAFGYPPDHRVSRLEEALLIISQLLRGETVNFNGRFHVLHEASLLPPPERPIPILVAGNGPRLLRLVARYADVWNTAWFGLPDDRLRERLRNLDAALAAEARDPSSLRRTVAIEIVDPAAAPSEEVRGTSIVKSADAIKRAVDSYEQLGIDGLIIGLRPYTRRTLETLAEVVEERHG